MPEDPVAQSKRFFKIVLNSSRNRKQRTDHEVGNTNQEAKNKDVVYLKTTHSESQLTTKSSLLIISYSPTSSSSGAIADKVYTDHSKPSTPIFTKTSSTRSHSDERLKKNKVPTICNAKRNKKMIEEKKCNVIKHKTDRKQRTEQDAGKTNQEKKKECMACLKSTHSEPQLTTKTSPRPISYSTTLSSHGKKPDKVQSVHSKSSTSNCSKASSTRSQMNHNHKKREPPTVCNAKREEKMVGGGKE
jgi:hypothetical protein